MASAYMFIERLGVFFVALNILPPDTQTHIAKCVEKNKQLVDSMQPAGFDGREWEHGCYLCPPYACKSIF